MNLLTQAEVARVLRCSVSKIAALRYRGEIPWLPGRPVKIELADLLAYMEREAAKRRRRPVPALVAGGLTPEVRARRVVLLASLRSQHRRR